MSATAVARRYAEAMADVAIAQNQVARVDEELHTFVGMMKASRELYDVFASPIISQKDKGRVLEEIVTRTRPGQATANLLRAMLRNNRLRDLEAVYAQFRREINERSGTVLADVTTAIALGAVEQQVLSGHLERLTGKRVQLQLHTDPTIIGGVITRLGSVVYDGSVRTQLKSIQEKMKQGV